VAAVLLESHYTREHTGVRPHSCQFCTRTFAQIRSLETHIRKVHSGGETKPLDTETDTDLIYGIGIRDGGHFMNSHIGEDTPESPVLQMNVMCEIHEIDQAEETHLDGSKPEATGSPMNLTYGIGIGRIHEGGHFLDSLTGGKELLDSDPQIGQFTKPQTQETNSGIGCIHDSDHLLNNDGLKTVVSGEKSEIGSDTSLAMDLTYPVKEIISTSHS